MLFFVDTLWAERIITHQAEQQMEPLALQAIPDPSLRLALEDWSGILAKTQLKKGGPWQWFGAHNSTEVNKIQVTLFSIKNWIGPSQRTPK